MQLHQGRITEVVISELTVSSTSSSDSMSSSSRCYPDALSTLDYIMGESKPSQQGQGEETSGSGSHAVYRYQNEGQ